MSDQPMSKTEWPHLLAHFRRQRDALNEVIRVIETQFVVEEQRAPTPEDRPMHSARRGPAQAGRQTKGKRALKGNERTNERTNEQKPGRRGASLTRRSLPDDAKGDRILEALRVKSPQAPGELAKALKIPRPRLTSQLKPLLKSGAVVATGSTANRQVSLPARSRAKEGL